MDVVNYQPVQVLSQKDGHTAELMQNTVTGDYLVRHIYADDKRELLWALQQIDNPHLPQIIDVHFSDCTVIYEQYVSGLPLDMALAAEHVTKKTAKSWASELADAVSDLHKHKILHRDIKPENIIVTRSGSLVLIDFDIARIYREGVSQDTTLLGTSGYAAPEQFGFAQSDYRTDIYALGITIQKIADAAGCGKSSHLTRVAKKCVQFDPARRYQSVNGLVTALKYGWTWPLATCAVVLIAAIVVCSIIFSSNSTQLSSSSLAMDASSLESVSSNLAEPGTMSPIDQSVSIDQNQFTRGIAVILSGDWVTEWQDERAFESYYGHRTHCRKAGHGPCCKQGRFSPHCPYAFWIAGQ